MGFLSDLFTGKKGIDIGNEFSDERTSKAAKDANKAFLEYQGSNAALDPLQSSRIATQEIQGSPLLGQLYGKGGALERSLAEEQGLAGRGYSLQPEDYEAYGQMSGQLARDFDTADQGLAQALASRGLSQSGSAPKAFMTSQGNKLEQLAGLQRQLADKRMNMNLQRLQSARDYSSRLGSMGQSALQDQYGRQLGSEQARFGQKQSQAATGQNWLSNQQAGEAQRRGLQAQTSTGGLAGALSTGLTGALQGGLEQAPKALLAASKGGIA